MLDENSFRKIINSLDETEQNKRDAINRRFEKIQSVCIKFRNQCEDVFQKNPEYVSAKKEMQKTDLKFAGSIFLAGPAGGGFSIYSYNNLMEPAAFDAINYLSYGALGFLGAGLLTGAAFIITNTKGKMKSQANKVEETVKEMSGKLNENVFLLSQKELDILDVVAKIIKENTFLKDFLFSKKIQEKYSASDLSNKSKYNVSKMILNKEWSLESRLLFVVEVMKKLEKEKLPEIKSKD